MKNILLLWMFCISISVPIISLSNTTSELSYKNENILIVGGDNALPPVSFLQNDLPAGLAIDLANDVADSLNMEIDIKLYPWSKTPDMLLSGEIDVIAGMYYSIDRENSFVFSDPIFQAFFSCYTRKSSRIISLDQALSSSVVVRAGSQIESVIKERGTASRLISVSSDKEALKLVSSGSYDCAIVEKQKVLSTLKKENLKEIGSLPESFPVCFAARISDSLLIHNFNKELRKLRFSERFQELHTKWFVPHEKKFLSKRVQNIIAGTGLAILIILAIVLSWVYFLKREVNRKSLLLRFELEERNKAEKALAESEHMISVFMDNLPVIVVIKDVNSRVLYTNEYVNETRGAKSWLGKTPTSYLEKEFAEKIKADDERALIEGIVHIDAEYFPLPDGTPKYYDTHKFRIDMEDEEPLIGVVAVDTTRRKNALDQLADYQKNLELMVEQRTEQLIKNKLTLEAEIDARVHTENMLRKSEEQVRSIFNYSAVGICLLDLEMNFLKVNDAASKMSGYSREELLRMDVPQVIHKDDLDEAIKSITTLVSKEIDTDLNRFRIFKKDGEERLLDVWTTSLHDENHNIKELIISFLDITDIQKAIDAQLETEQLKTATQLAGAVAHEFNNPLAVIQMTTELLLPLCDNDSGKELMEKIPTQVAKMKNLVDTLKNLKSVKPMDYVEGTQILDLHDEHSKE